MVTHEFVAEQHEDSGLLGWRQKLQPGFDPLPGMAVAHDVLEHFPGGNESAHDEFQALGAAYRIRGEVGYFHHLSSQPAWKHLSAEMPDIFTHVYVTREALLADPPAHALRPLRSYDAERAEFTFRKCLREGCNEVRNMHEGVDLKDDIEDFIRKGVAWMRVGYRRVSKRYGVMHLSNVNDLFHQISAEADKHLAAASEGDLLRVTILSVQRCFYSMKHLSSYEEGVWHETGT